MSGIRQLPGDTNAGLEFSHQAWTPGTHVTLVRVPWDAMYKDTVGFPHTNALNKWIDDQPTDTVRIDAMTYAKPGVPIRLDLPYNTVQAYNYLRVYNGPQPVPGERHGRYWYYFITGVTYLAPNTTMLTLQLDAWQTFIRDVTITQAYVDQGHLGIAAENGFEDHGRKYLTVAEGLDIGNEYVVAETHAEILASARDQSYEILVLSNVDLQKDPGTPTAPRMVTATGSQMESLPNGSSLYWFGSAGDFGAWLEAMQQAPWVTQGIIQIIAVPKLEDLFKEFTTETVNGIAPGGKTFTLKRIDHAVPHPEGFNVKLASAWRDKLLPERYRHLKKLLTSPYCVVELTSYTGQPLVLKPENMPSEDLELLRFAHMAPPGPRVAWTPKHYNAPDNRGAYDSGEFLDMVTGITNFPSFSLVNNAYLSYLAANMNNIAYGYQSADWSQQRALAGNQLSYDQASAGMALSDQLTGISVGAATAQTMQANQTAGYRGLVNGANALVNGLQGGAAGMAGAAIGMANAAADWAITTNQNTQSNMISNQAAQQSNAASVANQGFVRDGNKNLADWAARGDYANQIAAVQARVQDAKMIQPTTSGQVGGDAFNLAAYSWGVWAKIKMLQPAAMDQIAMYWLRFGYRLGRWVAQLPPHFKCMTDFSYWRLREVYIVSGECPEQIKQTLRGIFEKGVTVWDTPEKIGRTVLWDNKPVKGIWV